MLGKLTVSDAEAYLKSLGFDHNESTELTEANHFQAISDDGTWVDFDMTTREILLRWKR